MSAELTILDWVLLGGAVVFVVAGGILGVSSQLGALAGFLVAPLVGCACWGGACAVAAALGFPEGLSATGVAAVVDLVAALVAFGLVRIMVKRFVQGCLGRFANAVVGAVVGAFAALALLAVMVGVGTASPGSYARGFCATRSVVVHVVAAWLDDHIRGWTS